MLDHVRNGLLAPAEVTEIANLFHKYFTNMMFFIYFSVKEETSWFKSLYCK